MNCISNSSLMMSKAEGKNLIKIAVPKSSLSSKVSCGDHTRMLIQNYQNFKRSSEPARFMYYENGSWVDYRGEVVDVLKLGFAEGKPVVEAEIDGYKFLFELYRMIEIQLESGNERSIAWIDVNGKCFFPKAFVDNNHDKGNGSVNCDADSVTVEIEIKVTENSGNLEDSNHCELNKFGSSNKRKRERFESVEKQTSEGSASSFNGAKKLQMVGNEFHSSRWPNATVLGVEEKGHSVVKNLFLSGLGKLKHGATVSSIHQWVRTGPVSNARHAMFLKQMEITKTARGDSNTVFAWYATSATGVESILKYGFVMPLQNDPGHQGHGNGIYLSPIQTSHDSAMLSETDANGEKHIILCRVILGRCEKVEAGSQQAHPSSAEYDSGVDDLVNPKCYVVWYANMNTHILPQCVVSYKLINVPDRVNATSNVNYGLTGKLFSTLRSYLPSYKIHELQTLCGSYKEGKLGKDVFLEKLRSIVGDKTLQSAIHDIRG